MKYYKNQLILNIKIYVNGKISPEDYITVTEITSSQVTTQISEFITSKPSEAMARKLHQLHGCNEEIQ